MTSNYDYVKAWRGRLENKSKRTEEARRYRLKHPETGKKSKKKHRDNNIDKIREKDKMAKREYRKTDKYKAAQAIRNKRNKAKLLAKRIIIAGREPGDICELCDGPAEHYINHNRTQLVFDHDHAIGDEDDPNAFRGWICDRCNRALGQVKDDIVILQKMINYLKKNIKIINT